MVSKDSKFQYSPEIFQNELGDYINLVGAEVQFVKQHLHFKHVVRSRGPRLQDHSTGPWWRRTEQHYGVQDDQRRLDGVDKSGEKERNN